MVGLFAPVVSVNAQALGVARSSAVPAPQETKEEQTPAPETGVQDSVETRAPNILNPVVQSDSAQNNLLNVELTEEEQKIVEELRERDEEVRAHENAHKTAGGGVVGAISYETVTGPDGKEYAVSGEAQIDTSPVPGNPEATVRKMDQVIRAALAPAEPSSQDFAVARAAQAARLAAQREATEQRQAEAQGDEDAPATSIEEAQQEARAGETRSDDSFERGQQIIQAIENLITASLLRA